METLENLNRRIEFGRQVDNESSKIFFSLEPTLRFALINYLLRKHGAEVAGQPLSHMGDLELIRIFDEIVQPDEVMNEQIYELYQAITDYRLIAFAQRNGNQNQVIKDRINKLKETDYYLGVMENVVRKLLSRVNTVVN